jgi:uncharacterized membrane protein
VLRLLVVPLLPIWLAFLPNAPYLVTDVMHVPHQASAPIWYDVLLYVTFAWTGCFLGLVSLVLIQDIVRHIAGEIAGWAFTGAALILSGFGVYLGRFLRWNSWDLVTRPGEILNDVLAPLRDPVAHLHTVVFSLLFAALFCCMYVMVMALAHLRDEGYRPAPRDSAPG